MGAKALPRAFLFFLCVIWAASGKEFGSSGAEVESVADLQEVTVDPTKVINLSWRPRAFLYERFLTDNECDHLINLARDNLTKSLVTNHHSGNSVESEIRTSSGMSLHKAQDEIVKTIEDKIAAWTLLPPENGEPLHVLHYGSGQKYGPHTDYFEDKYNTGALGGHRIATVLMYLSDVIKGGETVFPTAEDTSTAKDNTWTECGKTGLAVKPRKGNALLFYSLHPDATTDQDSLHMGCPVVEGEKWSATKWIHVSPLREQDTTCFDENEMCGEWALYGECIRNPMYMLGSTSTSTGACLKSCKAC